MMNLRDRSFIQIAELFALRINIWYVALDHGGYVNYTRLKSRYAQNPGTNKRKQGCRGQGNAKKHGLPETVFLRLFIPSSLYS